MGTATTQDALDRLEILRRKLEDEGLYVRAKTACPAIEEINRLQKRRAWKVRPYEANDWLITYEPPTDELRRYMEFVEISPTESQP